MLKHFFMAALLAATAITVYGCSGLSNEQSMQQCQAEQAGRGDCFDDKSYADCLNCYESCGDACVPDNGCPARYNCPGDQASSGQPE
jgi:hypothetical protein